MELSSGQRNRLSSFKRAYHADKQKDLSLHMSSFPFKIIAGDVRINMSDTESTIAKELAPAIAMATLIVSLGPIITISYFWWFIGLVTSMVVGLEIYQRWKKKQDPVQKTMKHIRHNLHQFKIIGKDVNIQSPSSKREDIKKGSSSPSFSPKLLKRKLVKRMNVNKF